MTGGSKIVGIRPQHSVDDAQKPRAKAGAASKAAPMGSFEEESEPPANRLLPKVFAALLGLLALGWIALATIAFLEPLNGTPPSLSQMAEFLPLLCAPLALIGVLWVILLRSSRAEAARFESVVDRMRREEARLSAILDDLAARIDASRAALAEQGAAMASIGAETSERLSDVSQAMQGQLDAINRHAATLESRTSGARSDMNGLLTDMPRAHAEVHRMAELLDTTGQSAMTAANELAAQLALLAERGRNADDIASRSAQRLAERVAHLDDMARIATARMTEASTATVDAVGDALDRATSMLTTARKDLEAQGQATVSLIEQGHAALAASGAESAASLAARMASIGSQMDQIGQLFMAQDEASRALLTRMAAEIDALDARFGGLSGTASANAEQASAALTKLRTQAEQLLESLHAGGQTAGGLIVQAETLLTALDASVREIDETLPLAHKRLEETAAASRQVARAAMPEITALETASSAALDRLRDAEALVTGQRDMIDRLVQTVSEAMTESRATAEALSREIDNAEEQARSLTGTAAPQLIDALLRIKDTANQAAEHARLALDHVVPEAARKLGAEARDALGAALSGPVEEQMALIAKRAEQAIEAAREATDRLTRDVAAISAATLGLEERIEEAKDEAVRGDRAQFSRRMARILDALNSSAISVTRALSADVSDTAWGAYLRGERGIFTRRAVRLIGSSEARELRQLYLQDDGFQEQVNLYIHDFEAMLRGVMATRDGDALSVTLISSDAGKLYVMLAQAIERLRV